MRLLPPRPFVLSLGITAVVVWAVSRGLITSGVRVVGAVSGAPTEVLPIVRLLLALAVSGVVFLDVTTSRERVFVHNLGVGSATILGIGFGTAVLCEAVVQLLPAVFGVVAGGG